MLYAVTSGSHAVTKYCVMHGINPYGLYVRKFSNFTCTLFLQSFICSLSIDWWINFVSPGPSITSLIPTELNRILLRKLRIFSASFNGFRPTDRSGMELWIFDALMHSKDDNVLFILSILTEQIILRKRWAEQVSPIRVFMCMLHSL